MQLNYAIIFVSDMQRSVGFYRDVIGLPVRFETPEWTEFATEGATLALHKGGKPAPAGEGPDATASGHCRPGLRVAGLDDFHARLLEAGVTVVQAPKDVFGARVAQYLDPDGLAISVSEQSHGGQD